jgi:5-deoxy-glucuronate isomerase
LSISQLERSGLCVRGARVDHGTTLSVPRNGSNLRYVGFEAVRLHEGGQHAGNTGVDEVALVIISGIVTVRVNGVTWARIGQRLDPFSGRPSAAYLPAGQSYEIVAHSEAEVGICAAPALESVPARLIDASAVPSHVRGAGQSLRTINNILMEDARASSLLVTEVQSPAGNWSSYPPHKHDVDNLPDESQLEETYYFRINPAQGFAFQRVYTADGELDETMTVHDGDLVMVPRGYHVVAAAAEYQVYYLNVLAGPRRALRLSFDPGHKWIMEGWTW